MPPLNPQPRTYKKIVRILGVIFIILLAFFIGHLYSEHQAKNLVVKDDSTAQKTVKKSEETPQLTDGVVTDLKLDTNKNYGNKYSDGLLPVGDSKYLTTGARQGFVYECQANFVPASQAGAQTRGPWFVNNNQEWDLNKKAHIAGSVTWMPSLSVTISNGKRIITTNDLPAHISGIFPVSKTDPARIYDANPGTITAQTLSYILSAQPTLSSTPSCMGGEVGVMLTGVALFNAFDAGGRDAGAWEVQDSCGGHPQNKGEYHYHTLSSCITDADIKTVIGYALDGFPITGPKISNNNILTTSDLDYCHGITSPITLDGKTINTYHYVMTQDFPYSVSCFRASATRPPGQPESSGRMPSNAPPGN